MVFTRPWITPWWGPKHFCCFHGGKQVDGRCNGTWGRKLHQEIISPERTWPKPRHKLVFSLCWTHYNTPLVAQYTHQNTKVCRRNQDYRFYWGGSGIINSGFYQLWVSTHASSSIFQGGISVLPTTINGYCNWKTWQEKLPRLLRFCKHLSFWSSKPSSPWAVGCIAVTASSPCRPWVSIAHPCRLNFMYVGCPTDFSRIIHSFNLLMYSKCSAGLLSQQRHGMNFLQDFQECHRCIHYFSKPLCREKEAWTEH